MLSFLILILAIFIVLAQLLFDKKSSILSPNILFQVYFIIQLPLNLFLGTNFFLPRFQILSPSTSSAVILLLGSYFIAAQIVFAFTFYFCARLFGQQQASGSSRPAERAQPWRVMRINAVCAGFYVVGYLAFLVLMLLNGGYDEFQIERELWRTSEIKGQGWALFPATTMLAIAMCAVLINNRALFTGKAGLAWLLLIYGVTIIPAMNLGFRSFIFLPLIQILYFYHTRIAKINFILIFIAAIIFIIAFTLYGAAREIPFRASFGSYANYLEYLFVNRPDLAYVALLRSMGADIVLRVINEMGTSDDYVMLLPSFIEAITIPIPSALWSNKPEALSVEFARGMFGLGGGVSPTIVGEGYWHGGLLGIFALTMAVGALHAHFRTIEKNISSQNSQLWALSLYPSLIMMAEAFQGYLNGLVLILLANFLFRAAARSKKGSITSK